MSYTYNISTSSSNGKIDTDKLKVEIDSSLSIIIGLKSVSTSGDLLTISFKTNLSVAEKTELDSIVSNHDGVPIEPKTHYVEDLPQGGKRVADRGFEFEALPNSVTTYEYSINEDLYVKDGYALAEGYNFKDDLTMSIVHPLSGAVLHTYIDESPFEETRKPGVGKAQATNKAITETNFNGLKIRFKYKNTGSSTIAVKGLMRAYL